MPRQDQIARSIQYAVVHRDDSDAAISDRFAGYFYTHWLRLHCTRIDLFKDLRKDWDINEDDYLGSFRSKDGSGETLKGLGDMGEQHHLVVASYLSISTEQLPGYSGSTFFSTPDSAYVIKSVPRHFEHSFFKNDMLNPYFDHMQAQPSSLLIRITDFLECSQHSIGSIGGLAPSHHIVMENLLVGQPDGENWETWDLKPMSYFYPERDVAGGALSSEATKSKLADDFNEKIVLNLHQAEHFKGQLEKDTALQQKCGAVDYSLFLVRIPASTSSESAGAGEESWRTGIKSADGGYLYRAAVLDFFWAKHKVHAKMMTGLIKSYNVFDRQGPMSVTTTPEEYRSRFLGMCGEIVEVKK